MASDILGGMGFDVVQATSGPEARTMTATGTKSDLLVTDLIMPGMTGRTLADTMCSWFPDMAVIYLSGHVDADPVRAYRLLPRSQAVSDSGVPGTGQ